MTQNTSTSNQFKMLKMKIKKKNAEGLVGGERYFDKNWIMNHSTMLAVFLITIILYVKSLV